MSTRGRLALLFVAILALGGVAVGSVVRASARADQRDHQQDGGPPVTAGRVTLSVADDAPQQQQDRQQQGQQDEDRQQGQQQRLVFRNMLWGPHRDELVSVPAAQPAGARTASGVRCLRFYAAGGGGICLQQASGVLQDTYRAVVLDADLHERRHFALTGIPTRARVSASGRMMAWTVFVSGDSYAGGTFSTRTSILDTRTWTLVQSLEEYQVIKDGAPYRNVDVNFWGVTFADDSHFYATLGTGGKTYLVRGDVQAKTVTTLRENLECPSLSPDGTRLAFKKRIPDAPTDAPWHEYVLDLRTMRETPLAEQRSVDDQAVWLDDHTVAYALAGDYGSDLWTVPADGTGSPTRLATAALAPAVIG
ncbi:TolB-like translocation protein [Frankia sp. CcI49]|uniref:TolB family protein n=1 Tax=unclassified Frankia TaxID=2632575 RepID=UPI0006CA15EF|nr:PD40 domain-containing protein [Frankia sp. R43]KPM51112.1 TolB-like translocation protein [Frankia sp. R43]ONH60690.1 TolB-like translocation protein [Frankia sp. CcI49]